MHLILVVLHRKYVVSRQPEKAGYIVHSGFNFLARENVGCFPGNILKGQVDFDAASNTKRTQ
ncbi:hypothetical protein DPMN_016987 [Dreissena polymorpha]|uniref:Uncharacterized protein n=1 Tax=Dreissena polymorpha TaxID=45954 RepID=A0A9D4NFL3_DREPO|nr:hypothetical protein DPMN_016987 [Dreissena polymorpha]